MLGAGAYSYTVSAISALDGSTFAGVTSMKGTLDNVAGVLNIDAGGGDNTLMVSDAGSRVGATGALLTNSLISGLAPADISYQASGTFAGGITVWSGYGNDTIDVTSTRKDNGAGVRTITTLNTGLGDDNVTVSLSAATDGFFVLNTQGPFNHDYLQPGTVSSDNDTVNASASSLPLIIFGGQGNDTITGGSGNDIIFGDRGRVVYYDNLGNVAQVLGNGGLGDMTDGLVHQASYAYSTDLGVGGNDYIAAGEGNNIAIGGANGGALSGGFNGDYLVAGSGNDIMIGDNGEVLTNSAGLVTRYATTDTVASTGGNDSIQTGNGNNTVLGGMGDDTITTGNGTDTILGDNGTVQMDAAGLVFQQIESSQIGLGGNDKINTGSGRKIIVGGFGADTINGGVDPLTGVQIGAASDHIVLGDNGQVLYNAGGQVVSYETTDTLAATGGDDTISVGDGNNTILGGMGADTITSGNGTDTILGDNGFVQMDAVGNNYAQIGTKSQTSAGGGTTDLGGNDIIHAGSGNKNVLGGDGADSIILGAGNHIVLGDNGTVTYVAMGQTGAGLPLRYETTDTLAATGGDDTISVGDGNNTILGGMGADTITSGNGTDTILGDNGFVQMDAVGNNYAQIGTKSQTSAGGGTTDLGGNDVITALEAETKNVLGGDGMDTHHPGCRQRDGEQPHRARRQRHGDLCGDGPDGGGTAAALRDDRHAGCDRR